MHVDLPPDYYIHEFPRAKIEIVLPLVKVDPMCKLLGVRSPRVIACSTLAPSGCLVVLPEIDQYVTEADQKALRTHETAHCNGWKHD